MELRKLFWVKYDSFDEEEKKHAEVILEHIWNELSDASMTTLYGIGERDLLIFRKYMNLIQNEEAMSVKEISVACGISVSRVYTIIRYCQRELMRVANYKRLDIFHKSDLRPTDDIAYLNISFSDYRQLRSAGIKTILDVVENKEQAIEVLTSSLRGYQEAEAFVSALESVVRMMGTTEVDAATKLTPIKDLNLSFRSFHFLKGNGIYYVKDLETVTTGMLNSKYLTSYNVREIIRLLESFNIPIKGKMEEEKTTVMGNTEEVKAELWDLLSLKVNELDEEETNYIGPTIDYVTGELFDLSKKDVLGFKQKDVYIVRSCYGVYDGRMGGDYDEIARITNMRKGKVHESFMKNNEALLDRMYSYRYINYKKDKIFPSDSIIYLNLSFADYQLLHRLGIRTVNDIRDDIERIKVELNRDCTRGRRTRAILDRVLSEINEMGFIDGNLMALLTPIEELNLSVATYQGLLINGIGLIADLTNLSYRALMSNMQLNRKAADEVVAKLAERGLELAKKERYQVTDSILELSLPTRIKRVLRAKGISTIGALANMNQDELESLKYIGDDSIAKIEKELDQIGFSLTSPQNTDFVLATDNLRKFGFSNRVIRALARKDITTIAQLLVMSEEEVAKIRNLGDVSVQEIKEKLARIGFKLRESQNLFLEQQAEIARSQELDRDIAEVVNKIEERTLGEENGKPRA